MIRRFKRRSGANGCVPTGAAAGLGRPGSALEPGPASAAAFTRSGSVSYCCSPCGIGRRAGPQPRRTPTLPKRCAGLPHGTAIPSPPPGPLCWADVDHGPRMPCRRKEQLPLSGRVRGRYGGTRNPCQRETRWLQHASARGPATGLPAIVYAVSGILLHTTAAAWLIGRQTGTPNRLESAPSDLRGKPPGERKTFAPWMEHTAQQDRSSEYGGRLLRDPAFPGEPSWGPIREVRFE